MKRSILMLLVMSAALIFFGCEKMEEVYPESKVAEEEMAAFKGAKAGKTFEGIGTPVDITPPNNIWYEEMDDWRVTGTSYWVQPDPEIFEGTATLIVDARNPHEESAGTWHMKWKFIEMVFGPQEGAFKFVAEVIGIGVDGKVEGLEATWTYTIDFDGKNLETFIYIIEGKIIPPGHAKRH